MKFISLAAACTAALLTIGSAQALTPATQGDVRSASQGLVDPAQYREGRPGWGRPGWDRPGWRRGGPRVVCRVVPRRIVDRFGRVRIVREEVCRRRF